MTNSLFRLLRQVSYPQLRQSWGRTSLVVGGVAIGVALIVAINIINTSVLANFRRTIELIAGPAQLEVTLGVGEVGFPDGIVRTLRSQPDVAAAIPFVRGTVAVANNPTETLQLFGIDLTTEEDLDRYQVILETDRDDLLVWLNDPHSIALTKEFANRYGVAIGKEIELLTPGGRHAFTVRGILQPEGIARAFGGGLALMDLPAAQLLLGKDTRLDQIDLVLRDGDDLEMAQQRLRAVLPSTLTVQSPRQRGVQYEQILKSFQTMLMSFSLLCLVAGTYIIYNTTSTGAVHRAFVMASLRVIGADGRQLFALLMLESLLLGILGTLLGIAGGISLARLLMGLVSRSMGIVFQLGFPVERLFINGWQLAGIALLGIVAAPLSSYFAARRLASLDPLEVTRSDMRRIGSPVSPGRLVVLWFALVLICAAAFAFEVRLKSIGWGNFGSTLWFASSIVIAVPLVSASSALLSRLLSRLSAGAGRVAAESLFRSPARTGVTAAAVALVLTVAIMVASLTESLRGSTSKYYQDGGYLLGDLVVSAATTEGGWLETPLPEDIGLRMSHIPGVRSVESARALPGHSYRHDRGVERVTLLGLSDGLLASSHYGDWWYLEGSAEVAAGALRAGQGVNVSIAFAERFEKHLGDLLTLDTPDGPLELPIVGVVRDYMSDRGTITLSRRLLVSRWGDGNVNRFSVFLTPDADAEAVKQSIEAHFDSQYLLKILLPGGMVKYHLEKVDEAFAFTKAIQLLIVVVTVAGIFDLLMAAIWERRRELAVWRVIGADDSTVRRSVVIESATIGALGAALGAVVGLITAFLWMRIHFRYLFGFYLEYHFDIGATAFYILLVVVMTMLAGYVAGRYAIRQSVLEGIQVE